MNMASLCVFTLLVVSAAAQVPAPPIMSNTFQGSGEVEMHTAEMTDIGTCMWPEGPACRQRVGLGPGEEGEGLGG